MKNTPPQKNIKKTGQEAIKMNYERDTEIRKLIGNLTIEHIILDTFRSSRIDGRDFFKKRGLAEQSFNQWEAQLIDKIENYSDPVQLKILLGSERKRVKNEFKNIKASMQDAPAKEEAIYNKLQTTGEINDVERGTLVKFSLYNMLADNCTKLLDYILIESSEAIEQQSETNTEVLLQPIITEPIENASLKYKTFEDLFNEPYRAHIDEFVNILKDKAVLNEPIPDRPGANELIILVNSNNEWMNKPRQAAKIFLYELKKHSIIYTDVSDRNAGIIFQNYFKNLNKSNFGIIPGHSATDYRPFFSAEIERIQKEIDGQLRQHIDSNNLK